ncbi:MAG: hypothetical protein ABI862_20920 [Ilumatobacteraceae bacterium]
MNSAELIEIYLEEHAGTSSYIDGQLLLVQQAVKDSIKCLERGEIDYAIANLAIARSLINDVANILTLYPSHIWAELIVIFHAVDDKLNNLTEKNQTDTTL